MQERDYYDIMITLGYSILYPEWVVDGKFPEGLKNMFPKDRNKEFSSVSNTCAELNFQLVVRKMFLFMA